MKPMTVKKVIGYDESKRKTFNEIFEQINSSNETFEKTESEQTKNRFR